MPAWVSFYRNRPPPYEFKDNKDREKDILLIKFLIGIPFVLLLSFAVTKLKFLVYKMNLQRPQFQIDSASVSGESVTGCQLTATWNITLLAANPNLHLGVDYLTIDSSLYLGEKKDVLYWDGRPKTTCIISIATTRLCKPFFLDKGGNRTTLVNFKLAVVSKDVDCVLAKEISEGAARGGKVKFGLRIRLFFYYRTKNWGLRVRHDVSFFCNRVEFVFPPNNNHGTGIFKGHSRECPDSCSTLGDYCMHSWSVISSS